MAGRPAAARSSGSNGLLYGLIAFAILAALFAGLGIFAFTNLSKAQQDAAQAKQRLSAFGNPPAFFADEARATGSPVFQVMDKYRRDLATRVAGDPEAVAPAIEERSKALLGQVAQRNPNSVTADDSLLTTIVALDRSLEQMRATNRELTQQVKDLQDANRALEEGVKQTRDEFEAQVAALREELGGVRQRSEQAMAAKDQQLSELTASSTATGEEYSRARVDWQNREREFNIQLDKYALQIEDLQKRIGDLKGRGFDPNAILTKADGRVIRAVPGSDVIYIGLGERQNIKPGMTFEIYSQTGDNRPSVRGKASVEVATVMAQTAECKVMRAEPGKPILEGDFCVNIAYEQSRKPKFVIRGDFDLNYDGQVDVDGVQRITSLIRQWGGQVVDDLDETTDFVVIGQAPYVPPVQTGQQASKVVESLIDDQAIARSQHADLIRRAQGLYIPVITQTQFLFLVGQPLGETY